VKPRRSLPGERRRWILLGSALALAVGVGGAAAVTAAFRTTLEEDRARVEGRATVLASPWGDLEYLVGGGDAQQGAEGPWVLLVHGAGGGYDLGELMAEILLGEGFRWVAPSRFGYLGSSVPGDATPGDQAEAYAWLLEELGIEEVAVVALSAGGASGLLFALRFPERTTSLTLVSAGVTRVGAPEQDAADWKGRMLVRLYSRDFSYWALTTLFEGRFLELMGVDREVAKGLTPEAGAWVRRLVEGMRPASIRSEGALFDNLAPLPGGRIAGITAPTLIIHAEDDRLQLFENARFAEATIPNARLLRFRSGGHLVTITEQPAVREAVRRHILDLDPAPIPGPNPTEDP
jgi:pimeloyl-ACP methyl ester carboxylesterase